MERERAKTHWLAPSFTAFLPVSQLQSASPGQQYQSWSPSHLAMGIDELASEMALRQFHTAKGDGGIEAYFAQSTTRDIAGCPMSGRCRCPGSRRCCRPA